MTRRTVTRPEVSVDGWKMSSIAPNWGDLKTSTRRTGDWQMSFQIATEGKVGHWRHPALRFGARVEVKYGPITVWVGTLTEPDWDSGLMVALGACREAEQAMALTGAGVATTAPNTAIDAAIARGVVSWTRVGDFGTTPVGEANDAGGLVTLVSVLDAWAEENNSGWRIDRQRGLVIAPTSEATVDWFVVPGSGVLGSADDERVDRVFVRYIASTSGHLATASYPASTPAGGIEKPVDITDRGAMDSTKATAIAEGIWNDLRGRSGWTNGLTLTRGQVTTPGGVVADLSMIRAGHTVRLLGVPDPRGLAHNIDVVIGDTDYDWTEDTIQINPVGLAARDDESVLEQVGNLAADAMKAASAKARGRQPYATYKGQSTFNITAASSGSAAIAFPAGMFTVVPLVEVSLGTTTSPKLIPRGAASSTLAGTVFAYTGDGTSVTSLVTITWTATQMTPTSATG